MNYCILIGYIVATIAAMIIFSKEEQLNHESMQDNMAMVGIGLFWPVYAVFMIIHLTIRTVVRVLK